MALRTILLAYDGTEAADAMLRLACQLLGSRGRIIALYATRIAPTLPLDPLPAWIDQSGNAALDHAEAVATTFDVRIETTLTRVRQAADALIGEARVQEADAIFLPLGSWRHPLRRLRAARTLWTLRRYAPCQVLAGNWLPAGAQRAWEPAWQDATQEDEAGQPAYADVQV
jgi:hypothetical protein